MEAVTTTPPMGEKHWNLELVPISIQAMAYRSLLVKNFGESPSELLRLYPEYKVDFISFFEVVSKVLEGKGISTLKDFLFEDDKYFETNKTIAIEVTSLSAQLMLNLLNTKHEKNMLIDILVAGSGCVASIWDTVTVNLPDGFKGKQIIMSLGINKLYAELYTK